jgi:hypothetical protein
MSTFAKTTPDDESKVSSYISNVYGFFNHLPSGMRGAGASPICSKARQRRFAIEANANNYVFV